MSVKNNKIGILTSVKDGVRTIKFNKPHKKNALSQDMYLEIGEILNQDKNDDKVSVTVFTGVGDYYSSGNDFSIATVDNNYHAYIEQRMGYLRQFLLTLIEYPKILIAVINGPAIGIAVTMAALCDVVYASTRATFHTPFMDLCVCPEACSSYLLPRIMGKSKANELLLLGKKMNAREMYQCGFVAEIVDHNTLEGLFHRIKKYGKLSPSSVATVKRLILANQKEQLLEASEREIQQLQQCFLSENFMNAVVGVLNKSKSKL